MINSINNLEILTRTEHKIFHDNIGKKTRFKKVFIFKEKELRKLRKTGLSTYLIAEKFNCTQPTIWRALKKYGIK